MDPESIQRLTASTTLYIETLLDYFGVVKLMKSWNRSCKASMSKCFGVAKIRTGQERTLAVAGACINP